MQGKPSGVISLCHGAWATKALSVAVEIELFTRVSKGADSPEKISQESGIDVNMLVMLCDACKSLGLMAKGKALRNSPEAEACLVKGKEGYLGDFVALVGEEYYDAWRSLKEVVMTGRPVRDDRMVRLSNPRYAELYVKAMASVSMAPAEALARELKHVCKSLLEIGGGEGTYSLKLSKASPGMKATVFDSPFACEFAERRIEQTKAGKVTTQGGDFEKGTIPTGHDFIMLTHVLQSLPPQKCEALIGRVFSALPKGGLVAVNEFELGDGPFSRLLALNAFMLSNGGSLQSTKVLTGWLESAGFRDVKAIKTSDIVITITGRKV